MKTGKTLRLTSIIILLIIVLSIGGVFGVWTFANVGVDPVGGEWGVSLGKVDWTGSDILPDDGSTGEKHAVLIQTILSGTTVDENGNVVNLGLNSEDSYISNEIEDRAEGSWLARSTTLGSMDYWEASDIDKYFNTSTENITFVLYFPDGVDDTYYLYTTSMELEVDGVQTVPNEQYVYPIYETVLQKNSLGVHEAVSTTLGAAESAFYDNRITGAWLVKTPSFDPSTFRAGTRGSSTDTAIWTYKGQATTSYAASPNAPIYHMVRPSANTTYTITTMMGAKVTVLEEGRNGKLTEVNVTAGAQGTATATFNATAGTTYYFKLEGADAIAFEVT
jgi:hypothetical protein